MKLIIKYLFSQISIISVKEELNKLGFHPVEITLQINVKENISDFQHEQIRAALRKAGVELLDDKKGRLVEKIKGVIIDLVHYTDEAPDKNFSLYLSEKMKYDYTYLANIFSEVTGTTIEHFLIVQKIELAKALILYRELNLTEIAFQLHYSSVSHLSNQFKKVTGLTPSFFKSLKKKKATSSKKV
jgi:AraC-like DNA-binding protein